ncbi:MAG: uracil-DNA glycosylase [Gammaproteobacteria bacterium]|nr:uracil-DNA glycosylase [Gammaproteobacteria bacterium]
MDPRRLAYLEAMGVVAWQRRAFVAEPTARPPPAVAVVSAGESPLAMNWDSLQRAASTCRACELHETRNNVVFGVGARDASLMFIGEAPGAEEDRQGEPFVGAAGQLLNAMLKAIGLSRDDVFIANMLKCRPPGNRDPRPGEVAACAAYLERQVQLVNPRLVVALGRVAAQHLLQSDAPLGRLRGELHEFGPRRIPFLATYHPAYLLRKPADKRKSWEDLKRIREVLAG